jgi:spore germination cell wall hydrolase CwlJ-like protein
MTALALAAHRVRLTFAGLRFEVVAMALVALAAASARTVTVLPSRGADAATVTVPIAAAKAALLIDATTGEQANQMQAVGDRAKLINAALPFASGPLHAAAPFAVGSDSIDQRRALLCLTQAVYYEAGFEPAEGRRAVAQVVLNRMRHPAFPKSVCGVVYQSNGRVCQFTFVCDGALYRAPARDAWLKAEEIARAALAGYVERTVGEATHYHANYVAPRWAPLLAKVSQIGQHIFYRWPGAWGQPAAFTGRYIGEPRDPLSMRPARPTVTLAVVIDPVAQQAVSGPPMPRAETDVGGLLDTTKGWTLHIPGPDESGGSAARLVATQQPKPAAPAVASAAGGTQVASR